MAFLGLILFSCVTNWSKGRNRKVYPHRYFEADPKLFDMFKEATGIKVNVGSASADELIQKLELEGSNSPTDVLIAVDGTQRPSFYLWKYEVEEAF